MWSLAVQLLRCLDVLMCRFCAGCCISPHAVSAFVHMTPDGTSKACNRACNFAIIATISETVLTIGPDMKEHFVIDPLISKRQQLLLATQLCRMVLKVCTSQHCFFTRLIHRHIPSPLLAVLLDELPLLRPCSSESRFRGSGEATSCSTHVTRVERDHHAMHADMRAARVVVCLALYLAPLAAFLEITSFFCALLRSHADRHTRSTT